jgi:pimeloyl-ACP methyl ester carboxylesterase
MLWNALLLAAAVVASPDGVPIHYTDQGKGEPALVFIHCWSCDRHLWDNQLPVFAKGHRVVAIDLAGHGDSGQGRKDWTIPAFGEDVKAVADTLGLQRMVLVGSSMGGPVSLEAAKRMPGRVVGIVPVDTLQSVGQRMPQEQIDGIVKQFEADYKGTTEKFMNQYLFAPSTPAAVRARLIAVAVARPPAVAVAAMRGASSYDPRPALGEIKVPVRAINSDLNPTDVEGNRKFMPGFEAVILKGVGHYPMMEDPARFNEALTGILRDLRPPPSR